MEFFLNFGALANENLGYFFSCKETLRLKSVCNVVYCAGDGPWNLLSSPYDIETSSMR